MTLTEQRAPAAMLVPQPLVEMAKPAVVAMLVKLRATLWLLVRETDLDWLVLPTVTVPRLRDVAERVTGAVPVPERITVCGLVAASSVKTSVPEAAPRADGEKVMPTEHLAAAARLAPQVLVVMLKPALAAMPPTLSATFWLLVRVTVLALLVPPRATDPRLRLVVDSVTGAEPVPERETVCGLSGAASLMVRVPAATPSVVGENSTPRPQLAPAAMLEPQVLVATTKGPLVEMLEKWRVTFCRLVTVTVLAVLLSPTASEPKLRLAEESDTGALPLPVRVTVCVPALFDIVTDPVTEPVAIGVNVTEMVQVLPEAMAPMQVLV